MMCSCFRRVTAYLLAGCQIVVSCAMFGFTPVHAQTLDTQPPEVGFDTVDQASRGDTQVFTVTATDDQAIDNLVFHYRLGGESEYQSGMMSRLGDTDLYTFTLQAEILPSVNSIQYYIEAKDKAGNRTLQGFSFDPFERLLVDPAEILIGEEAQPAAQPASLLGSLSTTQKVAIGVVGLVVVGALVSASSSDSGSDDNDGPKVPVTIIGQPFNASQ